MEFIARTADFLRELGLSQRIVEKKNTIPILSNILIEATDSGLLLTSTDLEVGLRTQCPAQVVKNGAITVSAKKLFEVVRALPDEDVRVKATDSLGVTISSGRAKFKLLGLDSKDFPNLPECNFDNAWKTSTTLFRSLLSKVLFAVSNDESRFPLSGVLLLGNGKKMTLVATDGHRLAISECDAALEGLSDDARLLIPRKALIEVKQIAELGEETISCEVKDNHVYFEIGKRILVARMIEDQFPQYDKVVPQENDKIVHVPKHEIEGAARRGALLANEKARAVRFAFNDGTITVSASNPDLGEVREEIPIEYKYEEVEIAFNAQYLIDFLGVVDTDQIQLELKDGSTQVLVRPLVEEKKDKNDKEVSHFYVIMPMRI